jgi:hypothetical protein
MRDCLLFLVVMNNAMWGVVERSARAMKSMASTQRAEWLSVERDQAQRLAVGLVLKSGEEAGRVAGSGGRQLYDNVELGHLVGLVHA